jgi:predicted RNA-binding Zn ribbon-like protein
MINKMARSSRETGLTAIVTPRRDLCLDFANTLPRPNGEFGESLHGLSDLLRWSSENGLLDATAFARIDHWATRYPSDSGALFEEAIALRANFYRILFALSGKEMPETRALTSLNSALERAPVRQTVALADHGFGWRLDANRCSAASLLAPVLWSAGDLLVGPDIAHLRHCANPRCLWLFFDDSKNGTRRWCSMSLCGNRAKAHRHYQRQKSH